MILDSSAVVEVVLGHAESARVEAALAGAAAVGIGAPTLVETGLVLAARLGLDPTPVIEKFLAENRIEVIAFTHEHWREAVAAFIRFGKGRHPAALNFGDCLAYATARLAETPLLFVGDDFAQTDLETVAPGS